MLCVTTVTYSINLNGTPHGYISPNRGIRQGHPISSYIFIKCAEILSTNLGNLQNQKLVQGLNISKKAPPIIHLMYADDLLITYKASDHTNQHLKTLLHSYNTSAGRVINTTKLIIIHHPNLDPTKINNLQ